MGTQDLSQRLLALGFFSAFGTTERRRDMHDERQLVKPGTPFTFDKNQGMTVVYDEKGRPWIMPTKQALQIVDELQKLRDESPLVLGAYVPHSNDGGEFRCSVLPTLLSALAN